MIAALVSAGSLFAGVPDLPPITRAPQVTYVDRAGRVLAVRGGKAPPPVDVARLPPYVPAAFVAIEDRRFWDHPGFDAMGMARALMSDLAKGRMAEGASTITQQLARNLFLSDQKTIERKTTELVYAVELEQKYSKPQILGLYLSRVYFGSGAWGLEAASRRFFGKPARLLTIREAAALAAVMKSPVEYSPIDQPARSAARTRLVLDAMVETRAITKAQRARALASPLKVQQADPEAPAQYFVDWIEQQSRGVVGQPREDLVVTTTLDEPMEQRAAQALSRTVAAARGQGVEQGALMSVDGAGRIRAMVGGVDYVSSPYNRAVLSRRQTGSAWKPFVYLTAMEAGLTPDTQAVDEPVTIEGWSPRNYEDGFLGQITLQQALAHSINTVAAVLADQVGRDKVAATARRLGVTSQIGTEPAMALGDTAVTPFDMAGAYAAFANGGVRAQPYGVDEIRTASGRVLWRRTAGAPEQVIQNPPLGEMNQMLREVVAEGTGTRAQIAGRDVAGKTGTTSDYRDAWFAGYSGGIATVVWMGRDDNQPMRGVTGGTYPAEAWRSFMVAAIPAMGAGAIPAGPAPVALPAPPQIAPVQPTTPAAPAEGIEKSLNELLNGAESRPGITPQPNDPPY